MIQDSADINRVHLPSETFMRSIDAYHSAVPAEPGMSVDSILASANVHAAVIFQLGQRHEFSRGAMKEKRVLKSMNRVGVRDDPIPASSGNKAPMAIASISILHL